MKIAVCIKQVPTRDWQPRLNDARTWIREQDASFEMNEPDAYALEEALRLKEKHGGEVVVCSAGPARVAQVHPRGAGARRRSRDSRRGRRAGERRRVRASPARWPPRCGTSSSISSLTGLQSDDQGFAQTGVILAERLGLPHATIIMEVQVEGGALRVKRELEGGWFQWVAMPLPAVLTIQSGINQLRYATLKGIMAAKKKEIRKAAPPAVAGAAQQQIVEPLRAGEGARRRSMIAGVAGRGGQGTRAPAARRRAGDLRCR